MESYRPPDWEYGAWREDERFLRNPPVIVEERLYNAYEAGADAMYQPAYDKGRKDEREALRKIAFLDMGPGDWLRDSGIFDFTAKYWGKVALVPYEEEQDEKL